MICRSGGGAMPLACSRTEHHAIDIARRATAPDWPDELLCVLFRTPVRSASGRKLTGSPGMEHPELHRCTCGRILLESTYRHAVDISARDIGEFPFRIPA